ncbi:hypothetical protein [Bacillus sp. FJAT-27445]|uniref:hypothetical protein n=1 Tax=Bacillus sp. FJAT-27445 TaxID=1679166 RepID=UPI0007442129|nr:hypothetical protein [Bacillus sp. FJAT-27445]
MIKGKIFSYCLALFLIASLFFNYYLYKENEGFKIQLGTEYQSAFRLTIHNLGDGSTDFWVETLKEPNGDIQLERYVGELRNYSREFSQMGGQMSAIGMLLDEIIKQYYQLEYGVKNGEDVEDSKKAINSRIQLINTIFTKIEADLGENEKLWYKELSGFQTDTQNYVEEKYREFQLQNK